MKAEHSVEPTAVWLVVQTAASWAVRSAVQKAEKKVEHWASLSVDPMAGQMVD